LIKEEADLTFFEPSNSNLISPFSFDEKYQPCLLYFQQKVTLELGSRLGQPSLLLLQLSVTFPCPFSSMDIEKKMAILMADIAFDLCSYLSSP